MSVNQPLNKEVNESRFGWQVYLLWFIAVIAVALLILPLLPGLVANFVYSFSGEASKIYWYLSRASGIVSFSILWVSMALGLGITNKMARSWPGAPAAFAIHQHTSLLGLAFAVYHALVLMGDHFVDFSLPRLIVPFSIAYETFWVGLGQICFYIWLLVVMSFYIRQRIGQKTWRMIHYVNFVIYVMAFLHGVKSGTDSDTQWIAWYFWISGAGLVLLLAYRIYELSLKNRISVPRLPTAYIREIALEMKQIVLEIKEAAAKALTGGLLITRFKKPSLLPRWSQLKQYGKMPGRGRSLESVSDQTISEPWTPLLSDGSPEEEQANKKDIPVAVSEITASEIRKIIDGAVVTLEGTYQGKPIRVRIFSEPSQETDPEIEEGEQVKLSY
jgi:hypothetical protein